MKTKTPATLQEWQEKTGTPTWELAQKAGIGVSHMSKILSRSRRCSIEKALRLHRVTGVPIDNLLQWMSSDSESRFER